MAEHLRKIMERHLISASSLAREAGLDVKTVKSVLDDLHDPRTDTKRAILEALNKILAQAGEEPMGPEVFS
jgi:predicted transcriptional regulator